MYLYKYILTLQTLHNRYINYNVKTIGLNYFFSNAEKVLCVLIKKKI